MELYDNNIFKNALEDLKNCESSIDIKSFKYVLLNINLIFNSIVDQNLFREFKPLVYKITENDIEAMKSDQIRYEAHLYNLHYKIASIEYIFSSEYLIDELSNTLKEYAFLLGHYYHLLHLVSMPYNSSGNERQENISAKYTDVENDIKKIISIIEKIDKKKLDSEIDKELKLII